ncbi:MAG: hypothetical protein B7Z02_00615 [Rhodobacterales bacterium 32-67-9]|nr:MAG: hypothetical protein B7Z02_00615 [Rhodobacterales bacterium 32-67-9]
MNLRHLLRLSRWARHPPSARRVILVFAVVALCLALAGLEWAGVLPEGFGLDPRPPAPKPQSLP